MRSILDDLRLDECGAYLRMGRNACPASRHRCIRWADEAASAIHHPYWRRVAREWVEEAKRLLG